MAMLLKDEELRDPMILRWSKMRTSWKTVNSCKRCGTPLQIIISNYSLQSPPLLVYNLSLSALQLLGTGKCLFQNAPLLGHYVPIRCPDYISPWSGLLSISNAPPINMKITTERWETANNKPFELITIYHQSKRIVKTFQCILRIKTSCA